MSTPDAIQRAGIVQYADNVKENANGNVMNALFFKMLQNKSLFEQIQFYIKNIENKQIDYMLSDGKNEKFAKKHRESGNQMFSNHKFVEALNLYNQGIAFGKNSENLSLCYANRSAVYFELGMFEKCLENIKKAKDLKYPKNLIHKLNKRSEDATRGLLSSDKALNMHFECISKLTKPASIEQPIFANCLEGVDMDDFKKRKIQTKCSLAAGDIISMEAEPFSKLLKPKLIFTHCSNCLSTDAAMSMIPCKFCSTAMFCNEKCYRNAYEQFHQVECPIIDAIYGMLSETMWLGLRTVLIAIKMCGSVKEYQELVASKKDGNIFELKFTNTDVGTKTYNMERYMAILNLAKNKEFNLEDCVGTAFALKLLKENTSLINDENTERFLADAIYDSMKIARENALLLEETYTSLELTNEITFYGMALYPFASNFNLSCAPNLLLLNHKGSLLGVVIRPITSAGELYAGLAALNHITGDRNYRRNLKKTQLGKSCDCIACTSNYGRMESLKIISNVNQPTVANSLAAAALFDRNGKASTMQYMFFCDYLNKHPTLEYLSFQMAGAITQLIYTLGKMAHPHSIELKLGEFIYEKLK